MIYPKSLNDRDTIGIVAPSNGIISEEKLNELNVAKNNLHDFGFVMKESKEVRKSINGESNTAKYRAKDLMDYIMNKNVQGIIMATGGDFLVEILEYVDFNQMLQNVKWIQGYSDITGFLYVLTTGYDIATIYSYNITGFGYKNLHESQINNIKILKGEQIKQKSFDLFEAPDGNKRNRKIKFNIRNLLENYKFK